MSSPILQPIVSPALVGRDEHLVAIERLAEGACAGNGVMLLVSGEAGIGKSRLVTEARTRIGERTGARVLTGSCFEHDAGLPYAPFVDLLHGLLIQRPDDVAALLAIAPDLIVLLPELAGQPGLPEVVPLDHEQDKRRIQQAILRAFASLASEQPLVAIIEDIHWADALSLEVLQRLAHQAASLPLLAITTWRDDEAGESLRHFLASIDRGRLGTELSLQRLTPEQTERMLRGMFDQSQPIRPDFLRTIVELTGGNPFFVEEVVGALIAAGDIYRERGGWRRKEVTELRVPRSVVDAVQQRARNLSPATHRVLNLAAVSGQRFELDLIQHVLGIDDAAMLDAIRELIAAQLIVDLSDTHCVFRHALTREACYSQLLARERRTYHLQLAEAIERHHAGLLDPWVADLSYHFHAAGAWEQCLTYARRASERARTLFAPSSEVEHIKRQFEAAAGLGIDPPRDLYRHRALALVTLGAFEQANEDHETALQLARTAGDRQAEWQSLLDIGALWSGLDYERAGDAFQQALTLAQQIGEQTIIAQSLVQLGNWQVNTERPADAERSLNEALAIFEAVGDRQRIAQTIDLLGIVADIGAEIGLMRERLEHAVHLYRETNDRYGLVSALATLSCVESGAVFEAAYVPIGLSPDEAVAFVEESLMISREIGWRSGEAYALLNRGFIYRQLGQLGDAIAVTQACAAIADEIDHLEWLACAWHALGVYTGDLFDSAVARSNAERALEFARASGSLHFLHTTAGGLISACIGAGDLAGATEVSGQFAPTLPMRTVGQRRLWLARAELALATGDPQLAIDITERIYDVSRDLPSEGDIPAVALVRGEAFAVLNDAATAERLLQAAATSATERSMRPLVYRIQVSLAQLFDRTGRRDEAEAAATIARTIVDEIAASLPDPTTSATYRDRAAAMLPAKKHPHHEVERHPLTRREREVSLLVARGLTNREIAETLFVGERTVETHVGNILGKLGFSSRAKIAAWVVETGLNQPPS